MVVQTDDCAGKQLQMDSLSNHFHMYVMTMRYFVHCTSMYTQAFNFTLKLCVGQLRMDVEDTCVLWTLLSSCMRQ